MRENQAIFNDPYCWDVRHSNVYSVDNMDDIELQESIIHDILSAQYLNIPFRWHDLFRFLSGFGVGTIIVSPDYVARVDRVLNMLLSEPVSNLIHFDNEYVQIREGRVYHQAAMDFAGLWFEGYDIPPGVTVIALSQEGRDLIESQGIDTVAQSLLMDMEANVIGVTTIQ